jgi:hypothetical protein
VINQYSDSYGNAYSDAAKKVAVSLNQAQTKTLRLAILPDSGSAMPVHSGNPDCGAIQPPPASVPTPTPSTAVEKGKGSAAATAKFRKRSTVVAGGFRLGRVLCTDSCARVSAVAKMGAKVVARGSWRGAAANRQLTMKLTKAGRTALSASGKKKWSLAIQAKATSVDGPTTQLKARLALKAGRH